MEKINFKEKRKKDYQESLLFKIARMFSYPLVRIAYYTPITPNQLSFLSFICLLMASGLIIFGRDNIYLTFAGFLCYISFVFDRMDGEIARLKELGSNYGAWLDGTLDRLGDFIILASISFHAYVSNPYEWVLLVCFLATTSTTLWRYLSLFTMKSFSLPDKKGLPKIGLDHAFIYTLLSIGLIFHQTFLLVLFFAGVVGLVILRNSIRDMIKFHPSRK